MAEEVHITKGDRIKVWCGQPSFKVLGTTNVCKMVAGLIP